MVRVVSENDIDFADPAGDVVAWIGNLEAEFKDVKGLVRGWHTEDIGMGTVYLELADNLQSQRVTTASGILEIEPITTSSNSEIDFWIANWAGFPVGEEPGFTTDVDAEETLLSPATALGLIAVGAVATRDCWEDAHAEEVCYASRPILDQVAFFSSRGPTSDGRVKPEVLAPGFGVISARSWGSRPPMPPPRNSNA